MTKLHILFRLRLRCVVGLYPSKKRSNKSSENRRQTFLILRGGAEFQIVGKNSALASRLQGCDKEQAHALLNQAGGNLRAALMLAEEAKAAAQ